MAPAPSVGPVLWRAANSMNVRDLSKDDDLLSHLLVEKLGTGLVVHKMHSSRRLPQTNTDQILAIVRRLVAAKESAQLVTRQAVDELLALSPIRNYLRQYTQQQINAFATHASRYFELYLPSGGIEIAHTSRYSHHTGKSELCVVATRALSSGTVITALKGSMAGLTDEEYTRLRCTDLRNADIRRDFSIVHSSHRDKNYLLLGPTRFVNHDCANNCELFPQGKDIISLRVLRPIAIGEEVTVHYGDGYFGRKNRHCLCSTCENHRRSGYAPGRTHGEPPTYSDSDLESDSDLSDLNSNNAQKALILGQRQTRRSAYPSPSALTAVSPGDLKQFPLPEELSEEPRTPKKRTTDSTLKQFPLSEQLSEEPRTPKQHITDSTDLGSHNPIFRVASIDADNSVLFQNSSYGGEIKLPAPIKWSLDDQAAFLIASQKFRDILPGPGFTLPVGSDVLLAFKRIAAQMPRATTAQVLEFYYWRQNPDTFGDAHAIYDLGFPPPTFSGGEPTPISKRKRRDEAAVTCPGRAVEGIDPVGLRKRRREYV
ncbi:hypothetical protein B0H13DRAFT_2439757 [Mycena leptocephala]|nr:hypothetical protein B0H13DRAFT_2439757 [Mycena leptocephala]